MIVYQKPLYYWNYYTSLERDIINLSHYIEFDEANFAAYSTECTKLFLAIGSEVDVVLKNTCKEISSGHGRNTMKEYHDQIMEKYPNIAKEETILKYSGLRFIPFVEWETNDPMQWWKDYNTVKHHRTDNFNKANLRNLLDSMSALHIAVTYYYLCYFGVRIKGTIKINDVVELFDPKPDFIRFSNSAYYYHLLS